MLPQQPQTTRSITRMQTIYADSHQDLWNSLEALEDLVDKMMHTNACVPSINFVEGRSTPSVLPSIRRPRTQ